MIEKKKTTIGYSPFPLGNSFCTQIFIALPSGPYEKSKPKLQIICETKRFVPLAVLYAPSESYLATTCEKRLRLSRLSNSSEELSSLLKSQISEVTETFAVLLQLLCHTKTSLVVALRISFNIFA